MKKFYIAIVAALVTTLAAGLSLILEPGLSLWFSISAFVAIVLALVYAYDSVRRLEDDKRQVGYANDTAQKRLERAEADLKKSQYAVGNLQRIVQDNVVLNEELTKKLAATEASRQAREASLKETLAKFASLSAAERAANELARDVVTHCERLVETVMDAERAGRKDARNEALLGIVELKLTFCLDPWLLEHWYTKLPSTEQFPTAVLKEFVQSDLFLKLAGPQNNTPLHDELTRALSRKFV